MKSIPVMCVYILIDYLLLVNVGGSTAYARQSDRSQGQLKDSTISWAFSRDLFAEERRISAS